MPPGGGKRKSPQHGKSRCASFPRSITAAGQHGHRAVHCCLRDRRTLYNTVGAVYTFQLLEERGGSMNRPCASALPATAWALWAWATVASATTQGRVVDLNNVGLPHAMVTLTKLPQAHGPTALTVFSDEHGAFALPPTAPAGTLSVRLLGSGHRFGNLCQYRCKFEPAHAGARRGRLRVDQAQHHQQQ